MTERSLDWSLFLSTLGVFWDQLITIQIYIRKQDIYIIHLYDISHCTRYGCGACTHTNVRFGPSCLPILCSFRHCHQIVNVRRYTVNHVKCHTSYIFSMVYGMIIMIIGNYHKVLHNNLHVYIKYNTDKYEKIKVKNVSEDHVL